MIDTQKAERIYKKTIEVLKSVQLKNGGRLPHSEFIRTYNLYKKFLENKI
jgi:hypothetical protein